MFTDSAKEHNIFIFKVKQVKKDTWLSWQEGTTKYPMNYSTKYHIFMCNTSLVITCKREDNENCLVSCMLPCYVWYNRYLNNNRKGLFLWDYVLTIHTHTHCRLCCLVRNTCHEAPLLQFSQYFSCFFLCLCLKMCCMEPKLFQKYWKQLTLSGHCGGTEQDSHWGSSNIRSPTYLAPLLSASLPWFLLSAL
jgi:hypothetical protein